MGGSRRSRRRPKRRNVQRQGSDPGWFSDAWRLSTTRRSSHESSSPSTTRSYPWCTPRQRFGTPAAGVAKAHVWTIRDGKLARFQSYQTPQRRLLPRHAPRAENRRIVCRVSTAGSNAHSHGPASSHLRTEALGQHHDALRLAETAGYREERSRPRLQASARTPGSVPGCVRSPARRERGASWASGRRPWRFVSRCR